MRMSANTAKKYPLLGSMLEAIGQHVEDDAAFKRTLFESSGGRDEDLAKALEFGGDPWVAVEDLDGDDPRGAFSVKQPKTIKLARNLADRLVAGGDPVAHQESLIVLSRGLLHWLAESDWSAKSSSPGAGFELLLKERLTRITPPAEHERPGADVGAPVEPKRVPGEAPASISRMLGAAILDIAKRHIGQKYAFEPTPDYDDPNWPGPFDCAEYVSYCAFRAYGIPYGVVRDPAKRFNSYSGYWERDAKKFGVLISWRDALHIPGAVVLRFPPGPQPPPFGHLGICLGNGRDIYEARGKQFGVVKSTAIGRAWNAGVLIPGVLYDVPDSRGSDLLILKVLNPPAGHSPIVEMVQKKLVARGLMAEAQINGIFDIVTAEAVSKFQSKKGVVSDGEVGPETGALLGLGDIWTNAPVKDQPALAAKPPAAPTHMDSEILTLARTLYGEARGEPREGIQAVANVILNRVESNRYPNTVAKVCLQRLQFSCWNKNDPNRSIIENLQPGTNAKFDMILEIAKLAVLGGLPNLVPGVLHYHAKSISPGWVKNSPAASLVKRIGHHLFWSGIR